MLDPRVMVLITKSTLVHGRNRQPTSYVSWCIPISERLVMGQVLGTNRSRAHANRFAMLTRVWRTGVILGIGSRKEWCTTMSTTTGARIKLIPYGDEPRKPAYALILGLAILISLGSMVMVVIEGSMRWVVVIAAAHDPARLGQTTRPCDRS